MHLFESGLIFLEDLVVGSLILVPLPLQLLLAALVVGFGLFQARKSGLKLSDLSGQLLLLRCPKLGSHLIHLSSQSHRLIPEGFALTIDNSR